MPRMILWVVVGLAAGWAAFMVSAQAAAEPGADSAAPRLQVKIACTAEHLRAGDRIPIVITIKNTGDSGYAYWDRDSDRSGRMQEYELRAVDAQGRAVPDPRAVWPTGIGGGPTGRATLSTGQSFQKVIPLNLWAMVNAPGEYRVTAIYHADRHAADFESDPITVVVAPRSAAEMEAYVAELAARLAAPMDDDARIATLEDLVYTCAPSAAAPLLDAWYQGKRSAPFWCAKAFGCYLPQTEEVTGALRNAVNERGMAEGMLAILKARGATEPEIKRWIAISLAPNRRGCWTEGALAAQVYGDDRFAERLIAIATDKDSPARAQAIYALAFHRTDAAVAALKQLLAEAPPSNKIDLNIPETVRSAIRVAYTSRGIVLGRPLREDDFGPEFRDK